MFDGEALLPEMGWDCIHVEDYGYGSERCEMCDHERVRYIHVMQHEELPLTRTMGRVCAGHYGGDDESPKLRENNLRNWALRRSKWLIRSWRVSNAGNQFLNTAGINVVVFKKGRGYGYRYVGAKGTKFSTIVYRTEDQAKVAVFDALWPLAECFDVKREQHGN
jgi:hypothetical protein